MYLFPENPANTLKVNCGTAILLKDRDGILDKYDKIMMNCGNLITSSEISAKLAEKGASMNTGNASVHDIKGEIVKLNSGCVISEGTDYKNAFLLATGNVIIRGNGADSLHTAEGMIITGTLYYPESSDMTYIAKVSGKIQSYPDDAHIALGDYSLNKLLNTIPREENKIWISGNIEALDELVLNEAKSRGLNITCKSLFTYDNLNEKYGDLFHTAERTLVPDGYEIVDDLSSSETALYGSKLYVKGDFMLEEKDAACLEELEAIIVKGCASIPVSLAKAFRKIGKADSYFAYEGYLYKINGSDQFTHEQLEAMVKSGQKCTVKVNGTLMFMEGVTAGDIEAIAALYCNGAVFAPGEAKGALSARVKKVNGFIGDLNGIQELTGLSINEIIQKLTGSNGASAINTGTYALI